MFTLYKQHLQYNQSEMIIDSMKCISKYQSFSPEEHTDTESQTNSTNDE